jgi:putative tryptophan/tyrosine transport system substrate-binding protein
MRRREFIAGLGGTIAWPLAARAQQPNRMRRIGVLVGGLAADDPEWQSRGTAFVQALAQLGWINGRDIRLDYRFGLGDPERQQKYAAELAALAPDVILAAGSAAVAPLQQTNRTLPIVFANVVDPVGAGFVTSLAHPGGNATGFMSVEFRLSGKWLELLKQIAPRVKRVGVYRNPNNAIEVAQFAAIQSAVPSAGVELTPIGGRDFGAIERDIEALALAPNSGLIVASAGGVTQTYRQLIVALAARYRLPAVYAFRGFVAEGGLISYGIDQAEPYRLAAGYVDRILRGEKPNDLPVQVPTRYELVINLKTAKALGLTVPETLLATADEVIQ